jgi:hypothetical protein
VEVIPPPKSTKAPKVHYVDPRLEQAELRLMIAQYSLETIAELALHDLPTGGDTFMTDDNEPTRQTDDVALSDADEEEKADASDFEMDTEQSVAKSKSKPNPPSSVDSTLFPSTLFRTLLTLAEPTSVSFRPVSSELPDVIPTSGPVPVLPHLSTLSALATSVNALALEALHNRLAFNPDVKVDNAQQVWEALFALLVRISGNLKKEENGMEVDEADEGKKKHGKKGKNGEGVDDEQMRALSAGTGAIWALARNQGGLVRFRSSFCF